MLLKIWSSYVFVRVSIDKWERASAYSKSLIHKFKKKNVMVWVHVWKVCLSVFVMGFEFYDGYHTFSLKLMLSLQLYWFLMSIWVDEEFNLWCPTDPIQSQHGIVHSLDVESTQATCPRNSTWLHSILLSSGVLFSSATNINATYNMWDTWSVTTTTLRMCSAFIQFEYEKINNKNKNGTSFFIS